MIKGGDDVPMQNEIELVSHFLKRTGLFQKDNGSFVFKREINLKFPEKEVNTKTIFYF